MSKANFLVGTLLASTLLSGCGTALVNDETPLEPQKVDRVAALNTELGIGYMRENNNELAFKRLKKALDAQPNYSGALNAMGLLYERLGKTQLAESHFERAVRSNGSDSAAFNNYGGFLCRQGRVEEAMEQFKSSLKNPLNKTPETALNNAGRCLLRNGQPEHAEKFFREALNRNPRLPSALLAMIDLSIERDDDLSARAYLQRYLEVGKHTSKTLWQGVRIERELGDKNAASSYAMLLKANYPDAPETRELLASESQ